MGINSGIYKLVLVLHILTAIVGFGAVLLNGIYGQQARSRRGTEGLAVSQANFLVSRIGMFFIYAVFVFGVLLVVLSDKAWSFSDSWIVAAMVLYVLGIGLAHGGAFPNARRMIALQEELVAMGPPASRRTIRRLLRKLHIGCRTARKKKTMGHHPDRNAQFENIARLRREYEATGDAVISIDTKKKELLGNFHRAGTTFTTETVETFDHDFGSAGQGKLIPHGIYDLVHKQAHMHLNTSHDTSELCCDSMALWWQEAGRMAYPQAKRLLVLGDGGGSNSATQYLFKEDLQGLANQVGLEVRVAHYPPYCSKHNPIEHQVFPHITRACQGVIFHTVDIAQHFIERTKTTTGLGVTVRLMDKVYQTGRKYAVDFKHTMKIVFDDYLPKWNYRAVPECT